MRKNEMKRKKTKKKRKLQGKKGQSEILGQFVKNRRKILRLVF
jgi:hypothetical protein